MKKITQRTLSLLSSLLVLFSLAAPTLAVSPDIATHTSSADNAELAIGAAAFADAASYYLDDSSETLYFEVNEYDLLIRECQLTEEQFLKAGYSQDEIEESKTNYFENRLLELASKSSSELTALGYTDEQIQIIQAYDGRPLSEYPQIRAATATLSGSISSPSHSTTAISALFTWNWTSPPAFYAYQDVLTARWDGTNESAISLNLSLDTNTSYATVTYCNTGDNSFSYTDNLSFINTEPYDHTEVAIERIGRTTTTYAKNGAMRISIKVPSTATATITEAQFIFAYGMATTSKGYSVSFPVSFSISFGAGTTNACYKGVTITNTGKITSF